MYSTGIIKKIDSLGRIVLPKEIRRKLKIRENDDLEIYLENNTNIVLKKYSTMNDIKADCAIYAELLSNETGFKVLFTDKEKIIATKGDKSSEFKGEEISEKLVEIIEERMIYTINQKGNFNITKEVDDKIYIKVILPLIVDSKSIGSIIIYDTKVSNQLKDSDYVLLKFIAKLISMKFEF